MDNSPPKGIEGDVFLMNHSALRGDDLTIGYPRGSQGKVVVAQNLHLELIHGEVVCLVGPNGAGKSTLLRTLTGLQRKLSGAVFADGIDIDTMENRVRAQKIGVVLTERVNVGILPVFDLVALGRHPHTGWSGRLTHQDHAVVMWALESVGAADLTGRNVNELSDGERQKIMIARALAQEPSIIVLDEPTAFLDLPRRVEIMGLLKTLTRTTNRAILLSTHDLDLAIRAADRLWLMDTKGSIHAGAPEDLVLGGELESVFSGKKVAFDQEHGSFHLTTEIKGFVLIRGSGQIAAWTRRALRREGFETTSETSEAVCTISISGMKGSNVWSVSSDSGTAECTSIYETVGAVRSLHIPGG